ncbi:hypothetical protein, partial [Aeromonas dhakensis]|uniref:hypothetical protein n=1 Tax=Aeromonas dhakensis TaxID=196024 RepID=UPI0019D5CA60
TLPGTQLKKPAHLSGLFYCLKFSDFSPKCSSSVRSATTLLTLLLVRFTHYGADICPSIQLLSRKSTECDASTFLAMPALL